MATSNNLNGNGNHKRAKSSVLKSIIGNRQHKRNPSAGDALSSAQIYDENRDPRSHVDPSRMMPSLPDDHPHASQFPLAELVQNQLADPFVKPHPKTPGRDRANPMDDAGSNRLMAEPERPVIASPYPREKSSKSKGANQDAAVKSPKPKKSKSQTSLAALLSRPKSSKGQDAGQEAQSADVHTQPQPSRAAAPPPIYAQFASRPVPPRPGASSVPLNDARLQEEISRYTPVNYSPSKQRNFDISEQPTLGRRNAGQKSRPKSEYLTSSTTGTVVKDALQAIRRSSNDSTRPSISSRGSSEQKNKANSFWGGRDGNAQGKTGRTSSDEPAKPESKNGSEKLTLAKRGSRVMAAVAAFNMKAKAAESDKVKDKFVAPQNIESAFEALLDSRNVPQNMRQKLRSLDVRIKADFIKQDKAESQGLPGVASSITPSSIQTNLSVQGVQSSGPHQFLDGAVLGTPKATAEDDSTSPRKRGRPRSKTFTLNKTDKDGSPLKKQKSNDGNNNGSPRAKSSEYRPSSSSKSLASGVSDTMALGFGSRPKPPVPQDFVNYLQQVQDPRRVEVGRLHKLRLVLRNERVAWVEEFLTIGGMTEVVGLLRRIMAVEWREEHEDALLHEILLCLKALCTTELALRELDGIQATLFPELVRMIFDEEKKGPSEFNTRGIVFSLLLTYLADAYKDELAPRATAILSYLRDPGPPEHSQPLGFIQSMHQSRPYRVWCKEVVSVTKEVFWIFLHQTNVVPVIDPRDNSNSRPVSPPASSCGSRTTTQAPYSASMSLSYSDLHFPKERPPVPAAPYVGGVEWDATNYISTHLDLMNGLLASFETVSERNALRQDLRLSGFEKMMGQSLRTCKEKFYGSVHDGLKTWVAASLADGWDVEFVRRGVSSVGGGDVVIKTPRTSPQKKKNNGNDKNGKMLQEQGPLKVEVPLSKLDWELGGGLASGGNAVQGDKGALASPVWD